MWGGQLNWEATVTGVSVSPPPLPTRPLPPPPPASGQVLGPLSLDAYCQGIAYTVDLGGFVIDIAPYDGAVADGGTVYCAALNVLESGIDVYSDPIDLNEACLWQYGEAAGVRQEGADPPSWTCIPQ